MTDAADPSGFRAEAAAWLEANCPESLRHPCRDEDDVVWGGRKPHFPSEDARRWLERAAEKGWTAPTWPAVYGGGGLSDEQAAILDAEMDRLGARRPLFSYGIALLGPTLLHYGTDAQKAQHLQPIARGEIRWCQGFSEPGAGSDLASIKCRAELDGDVYRVNGQKIWTTFAQKSDWIFCLVRTDPTVPKHQGISFLLIDMETPGVTVRPIRLINGVSHFCEVFFDDVKVPVTSRVGAEGQGWEVAKYLLNCERSSNDRGIEAMEKVPLVDLARRYGALDDNLDGRALPILHEIIECEMDLLMFGALERAASRQDGADIPSASIYKLMAASIGQRDEKLRAQLLGTAGSRAGSDDEQVERALGDWMTSRAYSIAGGTNEIQLNIIARRELGL